MKHNRIRRFGFLFLLGGLISISMTVYADETTAAATEEATEEILKEEVTSYEGLTPEGNLTLVDDIGGEKTGKQFITLVSRNGNYFYLIIDRDKDGNENVHFLNLVDESDLLALMEEAGEEIPVTETMGMQTGSFGGFFQEETKSIEEETAPAEPKGKEKETGEKTGGKKLYMLAILGGSLLICGLFLLRLLRKKKKEKKRKDPDEELVLEEEREDILETEEYGRDDE